MSNHVSTPSTFRQVTCKIICESAHQLQLCTFHEKPSGCRLFWLFSSVVLDLFWPCTLFIIRIPFKHCL